MATVKQLELEVELLKRRNRRVEADKAWEVSKSRKALILAFTYAVIAAYMYGVDIQDPLVNAMVPTVAFALATMTMPYIKRWWLDRVYHLGKPK